MKSMTGFLAVIVGLLAGGAASAQQPSLEGIMIRERRFQGPEAAPVPDANFVFVASESFGGKLVKGAPYSAEAVTETVQTLADGNRIINRITSLVYRDSEGRTRREQSLKGIGDVFGVGDDPPRMIFISDPVAGVTYSLDARTRTAHKGAAFHVELNSKMRAAGVVASGAPSQRFEIKVGSESPGGVFVAPPVAGTTERAVRVPHPGVEQFTMRTDGGVAATYVFKTKTGSADAVKEDLGKQFIEGVEAEGTRTTITIPADEIGNERAIEIVSERWYSPELQLVVMTRHSDPRSGETTYRLTNINRSEPVRSLFEVPADYNIKTGPRFAPAITMPRVKRPE